MQTCKMLKDGIEIPRKDVVLQGGRGDRGGCGEGRSTEFDHAKTQGRKGHAY